MPDIMQLSDGRESALIRLRQVANEFFRLVSQSLGHKSMRSVAPALKPDSVNRAAASAPMAAVSAQRCLRRCPAPHPVVAVMDQGGRLYGLLPPTVIVAPKQAVDTSGPQSTPPRRGDGA
jgi:hypothetical protein